MYVLAPKEKVERLTTLLERAPEFVAWLGELQALAVELGTPIEIANAVPHAPVTPANPANPFPGAPSSSPRKGLRLPELLRQQEEARTRDGLRVDGYGRPLVQRGVQSYADVAYVHIGDYEFTIPEAWSTLSPLLAPENRDNPRSIEYFRRSIERDSRFVSVEGKPGTFRKVSPDEMRQARGEVDIFRNPDE